MGVSFEKDYYWDKLKETNHNKSLMPKSGCQISFSFFLSKMHLQKQRLIQRTCTSYSPSLYSLIIFSDNPGFETWKMRLK